jgi:peptidoglycan/LPS O-acetylase OafA/YrhL
LLVADAERAGFVSLRDFYVRRAKRILPAAALTLVVTDVLAYKFLNLVRAKTVMQDSLWAALFGANFRFAREGTNYFAQAQLPSPVQHYWSLAVEEQFYLVWPAILSLALFGVVGGLRLRRSRRGVARVDQRRLVALCVAVFGASLVWSIHETGVARTSAYFSPFTRGWELALGALIALTAPALIRIPVRAKFFCGWIGLAAIALATVTFSGSTAFPGFAALLPTCGAALVICSGLGDERVAARSAANVLAMRPMRYVGDRSYSFYLWHWPALILAAQYEGHSLSPAANLALLITAFGVSVATYKWFENPLRRRPWTPSQAAFLAYACIGSAFAVAAFLFGSVASTEKELSAASEAFKPTATQVISSASFEAELKALSASGSGEALPVVKSSVSNAIQPIDLTRLEPSATSAPNDNFAFPSHCAAYEGESRSEICRLGDSASRRTLLVFGDSHAEEWMPALIALGHREGWAVIPVVKVACAPLDWERHSGTRDCRSWFAWAKRTAANLHPTVLFVSGHYSAEGVNGETQAAQGIASVIAAVKTTSHKAVAMIDTPIQKVQPADCLLHGGATHGRCTLTLDDTETNADASAYDVLAHTPGLGLIDPRPWLCYQSKCPIVIGTTIAYSDAGHLTATYVSELDPLFRVAFDAALRKA